MWFILRKSTSLFALLTCALFSVSTCVTQDSFRSKLSSRLVGNNFVNLFKRYALISFEVICMHPSDFPRNKSVISAHQPNLCGIDLSSSRANYILTSYKINFHPFLHRFRRFISPVALNVFDFISDYSANQPANNTRLFSSAMEYIYRSKTFQKSSDLFLFLVDQQEISFIDPLSSHFVLSQIKFGVVVSFDMKSQIFYFKKLCFSCNEKEIKELPIETSKVFEAFDVVSLFPTFYIENATLISDLKGRSLRISCPSNIPIRVRLLSNPDGSVRKMLPGFTYSLLEYVRSKVNFTSVLIEAEGGGTGSKLANGKWVGTVGDLITGKADIGLVTGFREDRFDVIAFTSSAEIQSLILITGKHEELLTWRLFSIPFSRKLWNWMGFTYLVAVGFTLFLIKSLKVIDHRFRSAKNTTKFVLWPYSQVITKTLAPFFEESLIEPSVNSFRIFLAFWMFFAIIMSTVYKSKIFSTLVTPPETVPPKNLEELVRSEYQWGLDKHGDAAFVALTTSKNPTFQEVSRKMEIFHDASECIKKVVVSKFTCISFTSVMDFVIARNFSLELKSTLKESSYSVFFIGIGLSLRKNFPLEADFNKIIGQAVSQSLTYKWLDTFHDEIHAKKIKSRREMKKKGETVPDNLSRDDKGPKALKIEKLQGSFFALLVGCGIAVCVFFAESCVLIKTRVFSVFVRISNSNRIDRRNNF